MRGRRMLADVGESWVTPVALHNIANAKDDELAALFDRLLPLAMFSPGKAALLKQVSDQIDERTRQCAQAVLDQSS